MPSVPKYTKCLELGCASPKVKGSAYCETHTTYRKRTPRRPAKHSHIDCSEGMYSTKQWVTFRQIQLSTHPLCAGCLADGIVTPALHVDHVFPWRMYGDVAFTRNLFQSLCQSCHSSKTYLEGKGVFRSYGPPIMDYGFEDYMNATKHLASL